MTPDEGNKYICDFVGNKFWPKVDFHDNWETLMAVVGILQDKGINFSIYSDTEVEPQCKYTVEIRGGLENMPQRVRMIGFFMKNVVWSAVVEFCKRYLKAQKDGNTTG